jgi:hypothetical protein
MNLIREMDKLVGRSRFTRLEARHEAWSAVIESHEALASTAACTASFLHRTLHNGLEAAKLTFKNDCGIPNPSTGRKKRSIGYYSR